MIKIKLFNLQHKRALILLIALFTVAGAVSLADKLAEPAGYFHPDYDKTDLGQILEKESLTDQDYKELFYQTGLGKIALDELLKDETSGKEKILDFQEDFFTECKISRTRSALIVNHESLVNDEGKLIYGFNLAPCKNGYVLITKAAYSLGWRHGHAGIVTDAENKETLEAALLGTETSLFNINKWRTNPSFIMLRLKDSSQETLDQIASFAKKNMLGVPYGLTVGLTSKKNPTPENIISTQCAHAVWYPFMQFGYNVDYDGSWLVTPKDIANSDLFEIVQIYGVDPSHIWP